MVRMQIQIENNWKCEATVGLRNKSVLSIEDQMIKHIHFNHKYQWYRSECDFYRHSLALSYFKWKVQKINKQRFEDVSG